MNQAKRQAIIDHYHRSKARFGEDPCYSTREALSMAEKEYRKLKCKKAKKLKLEQGQLF